MKLSRTVLLCAALYPSASQAAEVEISGNIGQALPFYEQTVTYDPGSAAISIPGLANINLQQRGSFELDGKGGSTIGASFTLYPIKGFGIEARVDSAALDIDVTGSRYHVDIDLPPPIPDVSRDVTFADGIVDIDRLKPISLNLKLRTPGRVSFMVSGGFSYLPEIRIDARQRLGFGITALDREALSLNVGSVVFRAQVRSDDDEPQNRVGGNIGAGLRLALRRPVALHAEVRYFAFPKHTLDWRPELEGPLSPLEGRLLAEVEDRIEPIEFHPAFFQATIGASLTFP